MDKKYRMISMICGAFQIIGGIMMIVAAFLEDGFPRQLWFVVAICMFLGVIGNALTHRYFREQEKADAATKGE